VTLSADFSEVLQLACDNSIAIYVAYVAYDTLSICAYSVLIASIVSITTCISKSLYYDVI
jgi:hypothetical protein